MKKQIAAVLLGLGIVSTLAACSSNSTPSPSGSATSSATASASADAFKPVHNRCEGKWLDIAGGTQKKFGSCDVISLMADDREVTVGDAKELYFEGSGNTIHAGSIGKVDFLSTSGNTLEYSGDAPEVINQGENVVRAAE